MTSGKIRAQKFRAVYVTTQIWGVLLNGWKFARALC